MRRLSLIAAAWLAVAGSLRVQEGVPEKIAYAGFLTDAGSVAVADGEHLIAFRIYEVEKGGDSVWEVTRNVTTSSGFFNVVLGEVESLGSLSFRG